MQYLGFVWKMKGFSQCQNAILVVTSFSDGPYFFVVEIPATAAPVDYDISELGMFQYDVDDYVSKTKEESIVVSHTDYGWFSLAVGSPLDGLDGLDRNGVWHSLLPVTDAIVVHVSDALEHLSGGIFRSFPHRVTPPTCDRQSLVYFFYPSMNFTMDPVHAPDEIKQLKNGLCDKREALVFQPPMRFDDYVTETYSYYFPKGEGDWLVTKKELMAQS